MSATYTKLRDGSFGVCCRSAVKSGDTVQVSTKAGKVKTETIGRVLWTGPAKFGPAGTVWLCSVVQQNRSQNRGNSGGNVCAECGRGGSLVSDLEDGLMKHYRCCDIPPDGH